jgi:hypothetical protein
MGINITHESGHKGKGLLTICQVHLFCMPQTQNSQKPIIESGLKSLPELQTMGLGRAQHNKLNTMHTQFLAIYILRKVVCWPCLRRQGYCV